MRRVYRNHPTNVWLNEKNKKQQIPSQCLLRAHAIRLTSTMAEFVLALEPYNKKTLSTKAGRKRMSRYATQATNEFVARLGLGNST